MYFYSVIQKTAIQLTILCLLVLATASCSGSHDGSKNELQLPHDVPPGLNSNGNQNASNYKRGDLCRAARAGDLAKVREYIRQRADINENIESENSGNTITPLMCAVINRKAAVAEYLICNGASTIGSYEGWSVVDYMNYVGIPSHCGDGA